jgi:hypothetical protein
VTDPKPAPPPPGALPTLDDVARLTPESDFAPFAAREVDARVRNAALRKLFHTDPHFQTSDGLDVGVDEVFEIASSPQARQRKIMQARALGMLDDELADQETPAPDGPAASS